MSNWSGLLHDLLVLIARRLNLIEDYLSFGSVCKSWRSAATKQNFNNDLPRVPWLMLEEEEFEGDKYRPFVRLYNGMILKKRIPKSSGKQCIMESMGWLITVGRLDLHVSLLHPLSDDHIELPSWGQYNTQGDNMGDPVKAVLSASPSHTSNYVIMVIETLWERFLSFWRPGDLTWTRISQVQDDANYEPLGDVVYFNGHFYAISRSSRVMVYDVEAFECHMVAQLPEYSYSHHLYILESLGSLFVVVRDIQRRPIRDEGGEYDMAGTVNFEVFHINLTDGKATQTRELGGRAFFLGANASLSVHASQFLGVKSNHIYFTDDLSFWAPSYELYSEGLDNGVFNLADGSIQFYNEVTFSKKKYDKFIYLGCDPPTWVTPTLY